MKKLVVILAVLALTGIASAQSAALLAGWDFENTQTRYAYTDDITQVDYYWKHDGTTDTPYVWVDDVVQTSAQNEMVLDQATIATDAVRGNYVAINADATDDAVRIQQTKQGFAEGYGWAPNRTNQMATQTGALTMAGWVKWNGGTGNTGGEIFGGWACGRVTASDTAVGFILDIGRNNADFWPNGPSSVNTWADVSSWGAGEWHHVAATFDNDGIYLYLDGVLASSLDILDGTVDYDDWYAVPACHDWSATPNFAGHNTLWRMGNGGNLKGGGLDDVIYAANAATADEIAAAAAGTISNMDLPEPATIALLGLGGLGLIRRKK